MTKEQIINSWKESGAIEKDFYNLENLIEIPMGLCAAKIALEAYGYFILEPDGDMGDIVKTVVNIIHDNYEEDVNDWKFLSELEFPNNCYVISSEHDSSVVSYFWDEVEGLAMNVFKGLRKAILL